MPAQGANSIIMKDCIDRIQPSHPLDEYATSLLEQVPKDLMAMDPSAFIYPNYPLMYLIAAKTSGESELDQYFSLYSKMGRHFPLFEGSVFWSLEKWKLYQEHPDLKDKSWGHLGIHDVFACLLNSYRVDRMEGPRIRAAAITRLYDMTGGPLDRSRVAEVLEHVLEAINKRYWSEISYPIPPLSLVKRELTLKSDVGKPPLTYVYPRSFYYKIWASCVHTYQEMPFTVFREWLKSFEHYLVEKDVDYDDVIDILVHLLITNNQLRNIFLTQMRLLFHKRSKEIQMRLRCLVQAVYSNKLDPALRKTLTTQIKELFESGLVEATPAWERFRLETMSPGSFREASVKLNEWFSTNSFTSENHDVFVGEHVDEINELAKKFFSYKGYQGRRASSVDQERLLILLWINQFRDLMIRDLVWQVLKHCKYVTERETIDTFNRYLVSTFSPADFANRRILFLAEALASGNSILTNLLKSLPVDYGRQAVKVREIASLFSVRKDDQIQLMQTENKPSSSTLAGLMRGKSHVIILEDIIGSGEQTKRNLSSVERELRKIGRRNVLVHYWYVFSSTKNVAKEIKERFPRVRTRGRPLEPYNNIFSVLRNYYGESERQEVQGILAKMCEELLCNGRSVKQAWGDNFSPFGYGGEHGGGLLMVSELNSHNNSLPILWRDGEVRQGDESTKFFALFPRGKAEEANLLFESIEDILDEFKAGFLYGHS
jgi:hypothetical protein